MKTIIKSIFTGLIIAYLATAFYCLDINFTHWPESSRIAFLISAFSIFYVTGLILSEKCHDEY